MIQKKLTKVEQHVNDFINSNKDHPELLTIKYISENAFCSEASISRLVKKLGYKSLFDLRERMLEQQTRGQSALEDSIVSKDIAKAFYDIHRFLPWDKIKEIASIISNKKYAYFHGNEYAQIIGQEMAWLFSDYGIRTTHNDAINHWAHIVDANWVVIIFTLSGLSENSYNVAKEAHSKGATVITISTSFECAWEEFSEYKVYLKTINNNLNLSSKFPLVKISSLRAVGYHIFAEISKTLGEK